MSNENKPFVSLKPLIRKNKNFLYKGKKYPIDFDLIIKNSNYFYQHIENFRNVEDIKLSEEEIDITDESLTTFILCCQNESFQITDSNVFPLHQLSIKYEVPGLIQLTQQYINESGKNLCIKSIIFKLQQKPLLNDTKTEEETVSLNFFNFLNDDTLLDLPIPVLYRILNSEFIKSELKKSDEKREKTAEFLFKCLDLRKREASVLFLNFDIENQRIKFLKRLLDGYSEIFDFSMINPKCLLSTTSELLSEMTKLQHNYSMKMDELNCIVESQKVSVNEQKLSQTEVVNSVKNFAVERLEREKLALIDEVNALKQQSDDKIRELEEKIEKQEAVIQNLKNEVKSEFDSKFSEQKSKIDELFESLNQMKSRIDSIEKEKSDNSILFEFNCDFNGIFNFLRNNSNLADEVEVTRSSDGGGCQPLDIFMYDKEIGGFCTSFETNPWICIELKKHRVIPTYYTIKENSDGINYCHLRHFSIQGSNDKSSWETIDSQSDCQFLNSSYAYHTFPIKKQNQKEFKYIRIYETGVTWHGDSIMYISAFELYGKLL